MCVEQSGRGKAPLTVVPRDRGLHSLSFQFLFFLVAYNVLDFTNVYLVNVNNALELSNQSEHYIGLKTQAI